jgi:hypothetical protein
MASADPLLDMTWRELRTTLYEELARLPAKNRTPLVLCYLEGKTQGEAARLLGWTKETVRGRLDRGREQLRKRLTRRGLALTSALFSTLLAHDQALTIPASLLKTTVKSAAIMATGKVATGAISSKVAALASGALKDLLVTKLKMITVFLLAVGLVGTGIGTVTHQVLAQRQGPTQPSGDGKSAAQLPEAVLAAPQQARPQNHRSSNPTREQPKPEEKKETTLAGRVVDSAGKPVANAQVAVVARPIVMFHGGDPDQGEVLGWTKTNGDGQFRLKVPRTESARSQQVYALASASGHSLGFQEFSLDPEKPEVVVALPKERVIHGRLVDLQGQPAAGVQVSVAGIEELGLTPEGFPLWPRPVTTDDQGRFVIRGVQDKEGVVALEVCHPRFARQMFVIEPREKGSQEEIQKSLAPAQIVEGRVIAADTNKPLANARVFVSPDPTAAYEPGDVLSVGGTGHYGIRADKEGRFRLNPYAGKAFLVTVYAPEGEPYMTVRKKLKWPKGAVKQEVEVALPRGVLVRGKITEPSSGKPIARAAIEYYAMDNNPNLQDDIITGGSAGDGAVLSALDGVFQIPVLSGTGHLLINAPRLDYIKQEIEGNRLRNGRAGGYRFYPQGLVALDLKPGRATHEVSVKLRRGVTVQGRIVDPDGRPVSEAIMLCRIHGYPWNDSWGGPLPDPIRGGRFELQGLDPEKTYPVYFLDAKNKLGATVQLSAKQAGGPVTVRLAPCGTAEVRYLDADGKPVAGIPPHLKIVVTPGADPMDPKLWEQGLLVADSDLLANVDRVNYWNGPRTDKQGSVILRALIPGATYRLLIPEKGDYFVSRDFKVEAGKTVKLPDIKLKSTK